MLEKFIDYMKEKSLSENTYNSYVSDIKLFEKYYEDSYGENLKNLIHADVIMYKNNLMRKNLNPKTINRKLSAIKIYNNFLIDEGLQESMAIIDKDYIKIQHSMIPKTLPSDNQINKLKHFSCRDVKNAKRDYCIMAIAMYGGLRESEIVGLRLVDIRLDEHYMNIVGKGNKFRQVIINNEMYDALKDYLEERKKINTTNPYLFVSQKNINNTKHYNRNFCNRLFDKYKKICDIEKLHPHLMRAYFCTNALHNAGYTIDQVANQAGHSSINTTKLYAVPEEKDLLTLANQL